MAGALSSLITGVATIKSGVTLMARVRGNAGSLITQASFSSISFTVRDLTNGTTIVSGVALTISSVVFNTLQQGDPSWDKDSSINLGKDGSYGYNFKTTIPAVHFSNYDVGTTQPFDVRPHRFRVDVEMIPVTGEKFRIPFEFGTIPTWGP